MLFFAVNAQRLATGCQHGHLRVSAYDRVGTACAAFRHRRAQSERGLGCVWRKAGRRIAARSGIQLLQRAIQLADL
jgi:hypothetical protein